MCHTPLSVCRSVSGRLTALTQSSLTSPCFCYRHVMLPKDIAKLVPKTHLMSESEWRNLGVQQSQGWVHYMIHEPEPHILLFRRPLPKKPKK
uniref:Cyclin-dependent kinases regulatory subunit n=1 Tax=Mus spicilegus TaxID=10103 RepID=A0A8C6I744_MUSSI